MDQPEIFTEGGGHSCSSQMAPYPFPFDFFPPLPNLTLKSAYYAQFEEFSVLIGMFKYILVYWITGAWFVANNKARGYDTDQKIILYNT